jgi:fatty-acyl-CoA synthase
MFNETTYPQLLAAVTQAHGRRTFLEAASALQGQRVTLTYATFERQSRRVAAGLLALGLRRGDRMAIAAPNQIEWLELFFGAARIGVIVVTLNVRYRDSELDYMLNQSGARLVVSSAQSGGFDFEHFYAGFRARIPTVERVLFLGASNPHDSYATLLTHPVDDQLTLEEQKVGPDDPAVILYTSGTTGRPKGAVLTHRSLIASGRAQVLNYGSTEEDVYMGLMPLNHVGGITCTITAALLAGSAVILEDAFSPGRALEVLNEHGVTTFGGVPTMWKLMLAHESIAHVNKETLRFPIIGGANVEPALARQIVDTFPNARLTNLYGLSESSGAAVISPVTDSLEAVARSIGLPLAGVEARVVDADGTALPPGQEGELQLRGSGVAAGYWQMPKETAETFLPGGWLATGDMVSQEPDGHLLLRGRRKEMFIQGGYNVYPVEIENVLAAHPAVAMAAGIGIPDAVLGEVGCYYVTLRPGKASTEAELIDHCGAKLADYKVPRRIVFTPELPLTPSGKIAKAELRERITPTSLIGRRPVQGT